MSQLLSIQLAPPPSSLEKARITSLPILILNVHTHCNCHCVMCDIWKRKEPRELSVPDLDRHRESLISLGVRQVVLSGGEPLLHREFAALTSFFRDLNIRVTLLTTGLLLWQKAQVIASGVDDIILSLDGPPSIHDSIRRVPNAFQTIARGIKAVRAIRDRMPISCRTTVQKQNHNFLRATVDAAHTLTLDSISFLPADLTSTAFNRPQSWTPDRQDDVALTYPELIALESEIGALIDLHSHDIQSGFILENEPKLRRLATRFREHLERTVPRAPLCNAPWVSAVMESDGTLRPCFFHPPIASVAKQTLDEAINSSAALSFRSTLNIATNPICQRCVCSLRLPPTSESA